ncbi:PREDICTED: E3 ubiquitin/ISG15 ligase TRIM25-like [Nanorana parkeri]|uniref:E3 ubiquitin/ISG15 ligase TRIM25-like n=1 Tax=Nanorana parkeri TaxID=125878 RepID=UPI00085455B0|nr:PREDICTED: E3 ubiquitin/ISG15 ligase TRIM25-like [Nanorana parkeri]
MASADLKEELNCSICLEVYVDPVTLRCGHNFCRECINRVLDSQRRCGVFTCPECRSVFRKRPWLQKNVTLSNIAERFHSTLPDQKKTGVSCRYCIHTAVPAVQCCLHCEASLCDSHLKVHPKSPEHVLIEPTTSPGKLKCSLHKQVLQYYCTVDSTCLCVSCLQGANHRGHKTKPLGEASKYKKDNLKKILTQLTSNRQETEKRLQSLRERKGRANDSVNSFAARLGGMFRQIRERLDFLEVQTADYVAKEAERNAKPISDLIQQLEIKKDELCSKICHVEELCNVTDPLTVLQEKESTKGDFCVTEKGGRQDVPKIAEMDEFLIALNLQKELSEVLKNVPEMLKLPGTSQLQLDRRTAAPNVTISPDFLMANGAQENYFKSLSDDTDNRFDSHQVLGKTGLNGGRHYWEVELWDTNTWRIGMSYFSIDRDGDDSIFGNTDESWCLCKSQKGYFFRHDGGYVSVSSSFKRFRRLGIYLHFDKGQLSFYSLEPEVRFLHTFYHRFREPLHAAIRVGYGAWVKIVK